MNRTLLSLRLSPLSSQFGLSHYERNFRTCAFVNANKRKSKLANTVTAEFLFPSEIGTDDNVIADIPTHKIPPAQPKKNPFPFDAALRLPDGVDSQVPDGVDSRVPGGVGSLVPDGSSARMPNDAASGLSDEADSFGSLATPEYRAKLKKLDELWSLSGWQDDYDVDDEVDEGDAVLNSTSTVKNRDRYSGVLNLSLPAVAEKDIGDELMKPSLLYPDGVGKQLRRGERHSVEILEDGEERGYGWYQSKIAKLVDRGLVREALQLHAVGMKLEDRIEPNLFTYKKLIEGCSKIGEVEKALSFYLRMRERGDPIDGATYIGVFVSCSRCQDKHRGVQVADQIWNLLKTDGFHLSCKPAIRQKTLAIVYTSYMKVCAACGNDLKVLELYEEMLSKNLTPDSFTLDLILGACLHDSENGFAKALLIWRSFRSLFPAVPIGTHCYEKLLHLAARAGVGRPDLFVALLSNRYNDGSQINECVDYLETLRVPKSMETSLRKKLLANNRSDHMLLSEELSREESLSKQLTFTSTIDESDDRLNPAKSFPPSPKLPSSMADSDKPVPISTDKRTIQTSTQSTPYDRMSLLGGPRKFVDRMLSSECSQPTNNTFALLLRTYPEGVDAPKEVLATMDRVGVRPDEQWVVAAAQHVAVENPMDLNRMWKLLEMSKMRGISLSKNTFEKLARFLQKEADLKLFLRWLEDFSVEPSAKTFEVMFHNGGKFNNWRMRKRIFEAMTKRYSLIPSDMFRKRMELFLRDKQKDKPESEPVLIFLPVYMAWLKRAGLKWGEYGA